MRPFACVAMLMAVACGTVKADDLGIGSLGQNFPSYDATPGLILAGGQLPPNINPFGQAPGTQPPGALPPMTPSGNPSDLTSPFATATPGGGLQSRTFNEAFIGDAPPAFYQKTIVVGTQQKQVPIYYNFDGFKAVVGYSTVTNPITKNVQVPVSGSYGNVLITDNDSPLPTDRIYFGYNYYSGLGAGLNSGIGNISENIGMIGFEKTFLDGNASIGMRLPYLQIEGAPGIAETTVGDLSLLFKYALYFDRAAGNLVSAGLVITAPTAAGEGDFPNGEAIPRSVLFQPWLGFVKSWDRAYLQGVTDLIIPTNARDTMLLTNSLAAGYWVYQNMDSRTLNGIIPTLELHLHTPFNNTNPNGLVYIPNEFDLTTGVHLVFRNVTLTGAFSVPLMGPRPYNTEAIVNLNIYF